MADAADLHKAVGSGDGAWFATVDGCGRGQMRASDGSLSSTGMQDRFVPTVYLYDNYPGGVGQSEPLWQRQAELVSRAVALVDRCECKAGCPACVGPVLEAHGDASASPRTLAMRVLSALDAA